MALWVVYSLARLLADTSMQPALERANDLLHVEDLVGISWEIPLNRLFTDHRVLGLIGSYWYATLHYVVTAAVLIWLWRLGADRYGPARRALRSAPCSACSPTSACRPRRRGSSAGTSTCSACTPPTAGGARRLGAARSRRAHQRAGRVPVAARRLGAVGRAGAAGLRHPEVGARARLGLRRRHRRRHRRHRQPLGDRRAGRLAGGRDGLVRGAVLAEVDRSARNRSEISRHGVQWSGCELMEESSCGPGRS